MDTPDRRDEQALLHSAEMSQQIVSFLASHHFDRAHAILSLSDDKLRPFQVD